MTEVTDALYKSLLLAQVDALRRDFGIETPVHHLPARSLAPGFEFGATVPSLDETGRLRLEIQIDEALSPDERARVLLKEVGNVHFYMHRDERPNVEAGLRSRRIMPFAEARAWRTRKNRVAFGYQLGQLEILFDAGWTEPLSGAIQFLEQRAQCGVPAYADAIRDIMMTNLWVRCFRKVSEAPDGDDLASSE